MKRTLSSVFRGAFCAALFSSMRAFADEGGVATYASYPCANDTASSLAQVCKAVKEVLPWISCPLTAANCVKARQEIFTGLTGEGASPGNIKSWNGQGVSGKLLQTTGLCLMRDLASSPITAQAQATLPLGDISASGLVAYSEFDAKAGVFRGYHRLSAHAPVIGDIDILTQPFVVRALDLPLLGGVPIKVGEYFVSGAHALELEAQGGAESFGFELDAITIVTPYGTVSPKPHVAFSKTSGWSLSPFGGSSKMLLAPVNVKYNDVYGRLAGAKTAAAVKPADWLEGKPPGSKFCQVFAKDYSCLQPTPSGWDSQFVLGSRNVDPGSAAWKAPAGVDYPPRPDSDAKAARGDAEKIPNALASAGVKIEYSPIGLIPDAVLSSGFIQPTLKVFADPNVAVAYASQFDFWNGQASWWNQALSPAPPGVPVTPADVESVHSLAMFGGASVAGRFAIDSGVDLTIHIHIPLCCWLDDIDFNIIDVHPRAAFLETIDADTQTAPNSAFAVADSQHFGKTGQVFRQYKPLGVANADGVAHIQQCLIEPAPVPQTPPNPEYKKGDPNDLLEFVDMPCNICIGMPEFSYADVKTKIPPTTEKKTLKGFAFKAQPADGGGLSPNEQWQCGGPAPPITMAVPPTYTPIKNVGCFDQCRLNKSTGAFEVIASAKKLWAEGKLKDIPGGCY